MILLHGAGPVLAFDEDDVEGCCLAAALVVQPEVNLASAAADPWRRVPNPARKALKRR